MKKSKRSVNEDRLSELPDSVIFDIFWLLPMTNVVRTSVLSKRWRNLWTTAPFLNFDNRTMLFGDISLRNFVNRALFRWNGVRVLKFKFHSRHQVVYSLYNDVDSWMGFAKRNGVEELYLNVHFDGSLGMEDLDGIEQVYRVPQCLYSCSSLKELTLKACVIEIFGNVQWSQLMSLKIEGFMVTVTEHMANQILLGSPQLRVLILSFEERGENLSIQSSSLKELSIDKYILRDQDLCVHSELRICTPNLETLEITGIPYSKCLLINVSSLTRASLGLSGLEHFHQDGLLLNGVVDLFSGKDFQGNTLSQILPTIQHVENVTLSDCCIKVLEVMKMKCANSSFTNVKSLEFGCCYYDYEKVVGLLEIFPQLERLVLLDYKGDCYQYDGQSLEFEANLPQYFLLQLRTVEVTWAEGDGIFPLIEILLKYASKLERILFQLKRIRSPAPSPPSDTLFLASQKLMRMQRSSPNCRIDLNRVM